MSKGESHMGLQAHLLWRSGGRRVPIAAINIAAPERLPRPHVNDGHGCARAGRCNRRLLPPRWHSRARLSTKSARLLPPLLCRAVGRPARARIPANRVRPSCVKRIRNVRTRRIRTSNLLNLPLRRMILRNAKVACPRSEFQAVVDQGCEHE